MQLQNKFYLQPNSCFARKLHWKGDVTQNHAWPKAKEVVHFTAWTQSATEMAFSWIKSTSHFLQCGFFLPHIAPYLNNA